MPVLSLTSGSWCKDRRDKRKCQRCKEATGCCQHCPAKIVELTLLRNDRSRPATSVSKPRVVHGAPDNASCFLLLQVVTLCKGTVDTYRKWLPVTLRRWKRVRTSRSFGCTSHAFLDDANRRAVHVRQVAPSRFCPVSAQTTHNLGNMHKLACNYRAPICEQLQSRREKHLLAGRPPLYCSGQQAFVMYNMDRKFR